MDTQFYILLSQRTSRGPESFGRFFMGNDREWVHEIFSLLEGTGDVHDENLLFLDLMETKNGLPINLEVKSCTLEQLGENCKTIAREVFKFNSLR